MENTKAVAVADDICRNAIKDWSDTGKLLVSRGVMADLIQSAIDEATADLRAQLAERDAQLAAERAKTQLRTMDTLKSDDSIPRILIRTRHDKMNATGFRQVWPVIFKDEHGRFMGWLYENEVVAAIATRQPTQDKGDE